MERTRVFLAACVAGYLSTCFCGSALAAQTASLYASFSLDHLGAHATIFLGFRISSIPPASQSPLTNVSVLLPGEMGLATSGLGLENCRLDTLEERGPWDCPADALMGRGTATAEIPIGGETISESAQIEVFSAPVREGRLALWVFADGHTPVDAEPVFPAAVVSAPPPYGEAVDATIPLIPTLPGSPNVAVTRFNMALGSTARGLDHFSYYKSVRGRRVAYAPEGLLLPPVCPHGGFPFEAQFVFQDETTAIARTTVPCPRANHLAPRTRPPTPRARHEPARVTQARWEPQRSRARQRSRRPQSRQVASSHRGA